MNQIKIRGEITSPIEFDYQFGKCENFYKFMLSSKRLSGIVDVLPCCVPEHLIENFNTGDVVSIIGQIRTRNVKVNGKMKLDINIFVYEISVCEEEYYMNEVEITGFITKTPIHRCTPLGRRITDLMIAVKRAYDNTDYLPCIVWGRNADWAEDLPVGKKVSIYGRLQSREYQKVIGDTTETRVAYEVSGSYIGESEDEENG